MAQLILGDAHSSFAKICANGVGIPILYLLGNDGHALVTSFRLNLRFIYQ